MNSQQDKVAQLFEAAVEIETPSERAAFLDAFCNEDQQFRAEIEELLRHDDAAGSFLDNPCPAGSESTLKKRSIKERPGTIIGSYKLLEQIGEGGFGVVFMAEQTQPVRRKVALKVLKPGMDTRQVVARFEAERQTLALMNHPNIARVFDAGETPSGRPYFVMELVRGITVTDYCDQNLLPVRQRLELFVSICQAVQHAHQKGIIHRDLKPSNILVTLHDGKPVVKVIDFGISKALDQQLTDKTLFTHFSQMMGTPIYMSPEQAEMSGLDIDTRSDIYSLGVLLYELLSGTTPRDKDRLRTAAYDEIRRIIREEEPARLSARMSTLGHAAPTVSANRQSDPTRLSQLFRGELDWIVMKALEKERNRRYDTAIAFATDVQRYLDDEPVLACPPSTVHRLRKFVKRNKGPVLAAIAFTLLLLIGIIATAWQAVRATQAELLAKKNEQLALTQKDKAQAHFQLAKEAVDKFLNAVTDNPKLNEKDFFALRKELLETTEPFYRKFAEERSNDPELEAARGHAYHRLAMIRDTMGEKEAALTDYESMQAIFAKLVAEFPDVPTYRFDLAKTYQNRGNLLVALGRVDEAESAFREGLRIKEHLAKEYSSDPAYRWEFARSHSGLGLLLKDLGRLEEAEAAFRTALKIQEQLAPSFLSDPARRLQLAGSHNNLGILLKAQKKYTEAEIAHSAAKKLYEQLVIEFPKVAVYRNNLATSHNNLANLLNSQRKYAEAAAAHHAAQAILTQLVADFPTVPEYRQDLARSLHNLGGLLSELRQQEQSESAYRAALKIREQLAADFPGVTAYAIELGSSYKNLGSLIRKMGEPQASLDWFAKAIATLEPVLKKEPRLVTARENLSQTHKARATALDLLNRHDEAVLDRERAIKLDEGSE